MRIKPYALETTTENKIGYCTNRSEFENKEDLIKHILNMFSIEDIIEVYEKNCNNT
jgi:hypothetical protein